MDSCTYNMIDNTDGGVQMVIMLKNY